MSGKLYCSAFLLTVCVARDQPDRLNSSVETHIKRRIPVPSDALIDRQQLQLQAIVIPLVQQSHDMSQDGAVFAAGCSDAHFIAAREELSSEDGVVDFSFKDLEEAGFAYWLRCLGPSEDGTSRWRRQAERAGRHLRLLLAKLEAAATF